MYLTPGSTILVPCSALGRGVGSEKDLGPDATWAVSTEKTLVFSTEQTPSREQTPHAQSLLIRPSCSLNTRLSSARHLWGPKRHKQGQAVPGEASGPRAPSPAPLSCLRVPLGPGSAAQMHILSSIGPGTERMQNLSGISDCFPYCVLMEPREAPKPPLQAWILPLGPPYPSPPSQEAPAEGPPSSRPCILDPTLWEQNRKPES